MNESEIASLLSVEEGTEKISALVPRKLLDRMKKDYRAKVGAVREHGLKSAALFYFAARGVLNWEAERGPVEEEGEGSMTLPGEPDAPISRRRSKARRLSGQGGGSGASRGGGKPQHEGAPPKTERPR